MEWMLKSDTSMHIVGSLFNVPLLKKPCTATMIASTHQNIYDVICLLWKKNPESKSVLKKLINRSTKYLFSNNFNNHYWLISHSSLSNVKICCFSLLNYRILNSWKHKIMKRLIAVIVFLHFEFAKVVIIKESESFLFAQVCAHKQVNLQK